MATTILDTLVGQAKTTLSRTYLITGVVPAASLLAGWRVYDRGLARLQEDLKAAVGSTTSWTSGIIFAVFVLATLGGLFFVGRTLVLQVLQDLPGGLLSTLRKHKLATQVDRWWVSRKRKSEAEYRLTPIAWAAARKFKENAIPNATSTAEIADAVAASARARDRLDSLADNSSGTREPEFADIEILVAGLKAFYSLPAREPSRAAEQQRWEALVDSKRGAADFISRVQGELTRELLNRTAEARRQPEDERWLAPTRLGNRVAALDDYAERRYGIGTSTLWIRLWGVLDEKEKKEVTDAQLMLELLANLTAAFGFLALLILMSSARNFGWHLLSGTLNRDDWRALAFIAGSLVLAVIFYRTGVFAFGAVSERIVRLVDLQRLRLISGVGYAPPTTVAEELQAFRELNDFFGSGNPRDLNRKLTPPSAAKAGSGGRSGASPLGSIKL